MAARNFDKIFDAKVIKAKMNSDIELAIQILRNGLASEKLSEKDKIKLANDYLGLFLKLDDKIIRDEFNKEALKQTKLKTLSLQGDLYTEKAERLLDETRPADEYKFSPYMKDGENFS